MLGERSSTLLGLHLCQVQVECTTNAKQLTQVIGRQVRKDVLPDFNRTTGLLGYRRGKDVFMWKNRGSMPFDGRAIFLGW